MTFQELVQVCKDEYGKDNGEWEARYVRFINRGQREICNYRDWSFLMDMANTVNTVAGTESYTLTETDNKKLISVRISTTGYRKRLYPVQYDDFRDIHPSVDTSTERGTPGYYYTVGRSSTNQMNIKLYPVPDQVYTVEYDYYKVPTDMGDDADVPVIPNAYQDLLIDYVLWKSYQHERDLATAAAYRDQFMQGLREMASDYGQPETTEAQYFNYDGEEVE